MLFRRSESALCATFKSSVLPGKTSHFIQPPTKLWSDEFERWLKVEKIRKRRILEITTDQTLVGTDQTLVGKHENVLFYLAKLSFFKIFLKFVWFSCENRLLKCRCLLSGLENRSDQTLAGKCRNNAFHPD